MDWPLPWPWVATLLGGAALGFAIGQTAARRRWKDEVEMLRQALASVESANRGLQAAMGSLEQAAGSDRLTGAWNRRRFEESAAGEMALARRRGVPVSLLMLDLDHFKRVNDNFGHEVGDAVLAGASRAWKEVLRASDPLVRWGGEEFIVMSPLNDLEGARVLADKLLEATRGLRFPGIPTITVSIGIAVFAPGESLEAWIQRADFALYRAKAGGRDQVCVAEPPLPTSDGAPTAQIRPVVELPWEDSYACGHPIIDSQHRRLFELANALLAALTLGLPRDEIALRWNRLLAHTAQHFHDEEGILRQSGFPMLGHHCHQHQQLLGLARELEHGLLTGTADLGQVVSFLAMDLVRGHLSTEDAIYFQKLPPSAGEVAAP